MKIIVQNEKIKIENDKLLNAKAIDQYEIEIEFSEEWDRYTKNIVYICDDKVWQEPIVNGKTTVPSLPSGQIYSIGIVGTIIENDVIVKRKPTNLVYHAICISSAEYEQNQADEEELAETYENYLQELNAKSVEIQGYLNDIEDAYTDYNENAEEKIDEYNTNATQKSNSFNSNAQTELENFNTNAQSKLENFNTNATNKTNEFNENAEEKKAELIVKLTDYSKIDETGSKIALSINNQNFKIKAILKDKNFNVIAESNEIDLPLESVVVNATYDNNTKKIILTLQNGTTVDFSVADLVAGLQAEITSQNKLASDLVDDSNSGNKFVTTSEKSSWNGKYDKLVGGIPKTDLDSSVQSSLEKADSAIQNTDYATTQEAGVILVGDYYGTEVNSGYIAAKNKTYEQYRSASNKMFISKGTLENVLENTVGNINSILDDINGEVI